MPTGPDVTIQTPTVESMHLVKLWKKRFYNGKTIYERNHNFCLEQVYLCKAALYSHSAQ